MNDILSQTEIVAGEGEVVIVCRVCGGEGYLNDDEDEECNNCMGDKVEVVDTDSPAAQPETLIQNEDQEDSGDEVSEDTTEAETSAAPVLFVNRGKFSETGCPKCGGDLIEWASGLNYCEDCNYREARQSATAAPATMPLSMVRAPKGKKSTLTMEERAAMLDSMATETGTDRTTYAGQTHVGYADHVARTQARHAAKALAETTPLMIKAKRNLKPGFYATALHKFVTDGEQAARIYIAQFPVVPIEPTLKKRVNLADAAVKAYKAGEWAFLDEIDRDAAANWIISHDAAWGHKDISIHDKANIAYRSTYITELQTEADENGGAVYFAYVQSPHSNTIYKVCLSKVGHVFTVFAPTEKLQKAIAGKLLWVMIAFFMRHGSELWAKCGKFSLPWNVDADADTDEAPTASISATATWSPSWSLSREECRAAAARGVMNPSEDF